MRILWCNVPRSQFQPCFPLALYDCGQCFIDLSFPTCKVDVMRVPSSGFLGQPNERRVPQDGLKGDSALFLRAPSPYQRIQGQDHHVWWPLPPSQSSQTPGPWLFLLLGTASFPGTHPGPAGHRAHEKEGPRPDHTQGCSHRQGGAGEPSPVPPRLSIQGINLPKTPQNWSQPARQTTPLRKSLGPPFLTWPGLLGKAHPRPWPMGTLNPGLRWYHPRGGRRPRAGPGCCAQCLPTLRPCTGTGPCHTQTPWHSLRVPPRTPVRQGESKGTEKEGRDRQFSSPWRTLVPPWGLAACYPVSETFPGPQAPALCVHKALHSVHGLLTTRQCSLPTLWASGGQGRAEYPKPPNPALASPAGSVN